MKETSVYRKYRLILERLVSDVFFIPGSGTEHNVCLEKKAAIQDCELCTKPQNGETARQFACSQISLFSL